MKTRWFVTAVAILSACQPQDPADLVLINGVLYTLDEQQPSAQALAVRGDRIVTVGTDADVRSLIGPETRVIDLQGAFVTPGFNDSHVHIASTGALLVGVNLLDVHEPTEFAARVQSATQRLPEGSWITRGDWGAYEQWAAGSSGRDGQGSGADGPFTPRRDLVDSITPNHPVFLNRFDRSTYLANGLALAAAGITGTTPNPAGGFIERDPDGHPTGVLRGSAADLVRAVIPDISFDTRLAQVRAVLDEARRGGVTTIQDLTTAPQLRAYQALKERGELTARILLRPTLDNAIHVAALGQTTGFGDDWLKLIGYKAWVDGIMGSSGAMFFEDYDHAPGNRGLVRQIMFPEGREGAALGMPRGAKYTDYPPGNLERLLEVAVETGVPPHVHAIGDKGVQIILDVYEKILTEHDLVEADHRWRVIHAQVVSSADFSRFGDLNLVAEVNPYHISDDMRWMEERIGAERAAGAYAFRDLKDGGAVLIFGSDSPGTNAARYYLSPVYGLYAAVSRQTLAGEPADGWFPDQRLTIQEAIEAYTKNPAWASFEEDVKGTLTVGKLADIAVFDADLIEVGTSNPAALLDAHVLYTIVGGQVVYESANE